MPVQAEPTPLSVYGQLPGFERAAISASGDHVAIVGTMESERRLVVVDGAKKLIISAVLGDAKVRGIDWAGDQFVLIRTSKTVGLDPGFTTTKAELQSVLVVPLDRSKPWVVFAGNTTITGGVWHAYGVVARGGRWFGYFGGVTLQRNYGSGGYLPDGQIHPDLYEVDLQTRATRRIAERAQGNASRQWLLNADGAVGASLDIDDRTGDWTIYNGQRVKLASGTEPLGMIDLSGFSADGQSVIYGVQDQAGWRTRWFTVPLAGGASAAFLEDQAIESFFQDHGHRLIGYTRDSAGKDSHFFDERQDKLYRASLRAFPGRNMQLMDINDAFDRLVVQTDGPGDPGSWWLIDARTRQASDLGLSYPLGPDDVGPMRMVTYVAADGLAMEGVLTLPPKQQLPGGEEKNLPAIILPHGGPFGIYDTAGFDWIAQAFASRGYAVFQPNYRGSGGYGGAFERAGHGEYGGKMQTDLSDGLAELVKQGIVDPRRVCVVGASYGGYAALAGVTVQSGIYRCAVSYAGIGNLVRLTNNAIAQSDYNRMTVRNIKEEIGTGRALKDVSPIELVDKVSVPILLIHGQNDTVVDFVQSASMADALRQAKKDVQLVTLPGEDHWLSKGETRLAMLQAAVDFVIKHNPPGAAK